MELAPVWITGIWQLVHFTCAKSAWPCRVSGVSGSGEGGARNFTNELAALSDVSSSSGSGARSTPAGSGVPATDPSIGFSGLVTPFR